MREERSSFLKRSKNVNEPRQPDKPRNWWKYGCVAALLAFELTREIAVLAGSAPAQPNGFRRVFHANGYVTARGRWWRVNGNSELVPGLVTIECTALSGECIEASTTIFDNRSVMPPEIERFQAKWDATSVSYVNDNPDCARYSVRIDWVEQRATSTRMRKKNPNNLDCAGLEPKLEMELGDGFKAGQSNNELDKHFVPLVRVIRGFLTVFESKG